MFVVNIIDEDDGSLNTAVFHTYDNAFNFIRKDLEDHEHMNEDEPYLSKEDFKEVIGEASEALRQRGVYERANIFYYIDEVEYED